MFPSSPICIVQFIQVRAKQVSWQLYLATYESSFYFCNHVPAVQKTSKHPGRHLISPPLSHLHPVAIGSFAFRAQHTVMLLFLVHLLHPLTTEKVECPRLASFLYDSAASETSCKVTLCAKNKKMCKWEETGFWGARATDLKSHPSVSRLTIWTSEITWACACQLGSTAEVLAGSTSKKGSWDRWPVRRLCSRK